MSHFLHFCLALFLFIPVALASKAEGLKLWKERVNKEKLQESLVKFEEAHKAAPGDLEILVYLTRGYYLLADAHLDDEKEKKKLFEKATAWGRQALETNEAFKKEIKKGEDPEDVLDKLTEKEVPAIYWTAVSLGKWARLEGVTKALKYKSEIMAMVERVEKLDPDFFYGAVPRYWGGFYAVAPFFAGGSMKKSRKNFEKSIEMAPEYLGTRVLMAELYWAKEGDKKEFKAQLEKVLAAEGEKHPELGPENTLEKKKAEKLLKNIDEIF